MKNTDVTNPYLERVRAEVVDPALQLKTIEDELCGAIGQALGRQGEKVRAALRDMAVARDRHAAALDGRDAAGARDAARRHNRARERAVKARWELLVHRQAAGFTVANHDVVHRTFPIAAALPDTAEHIAAQIELPPGGTQSEMPVTVEEPVNRAWGDQLSWWQSVGRWK